jgi:hypothetical protein
MVEPTTSSAGISYLLSENQHVGKIAIALASFIGGVVSLRFVDGMSKCQRVASVAIGVWMADLFAVPIADSLGAPQYSEGCAAMIGLFGISIIGALFKAIKDISIAEIIRMRFGGGSK